MTVQADVNGERGATVPTPPVVVDMQVEAEEVTPEGVATLRWVVTGARIEADAKAPGEVIERLKGAAAVMAGVSGSYTSDPRGIVREIETNIPSTTTPAIRQIITGVLRSMRRMSPPFPAEPVGVGGQWKVKYEIEQNGARVEETSTIEIAKLAPDSVSLDITIEQDGAPQDLTPTAAPPGLTLRLVGLRARGRGETRLALGDLAPESARIDTRIDMQMREEAPTGQTTETKVVMETGATQRLE